MTAWNIVLLIVTLLVMLFGVLAAMLPVIPGPPIVWGASLIYAILTDFKDITQSYLIIFGLITAGVMLLDYVAGVYGAKRMGASRWGMVGAFIGMIVGIVIGTLPGFIIGPLIGAIAFELMIGRDMSQALKAGFGTFLGFIGGTMMKVIVSFVMIGVFLWAILF
jgi:uncharacterized protein YqgC (DUF456 family)